MLRPPAVVVDISKSMETNFETVLGCCKSTGEGLVSVIYRKKRGYVGKNPKQGQRKYSPF